MGGLTTLRPALRITPAGRGDRPDGLAVEEPLELRVGRRRLAVTMRTPGHDIELAHGFLLGEGVVSGAADVADARYRDCVDDAGHRVDAVLEIDLSAGVTPPDPGVERDRPRTRHSPRADPVRVAPETLALLPDALRRERRVLDRTGGLHAAGLFTAVGDPLAVREDVSRHNAVDKVLGWALLHGRVPARETVLVVSGRASFELVQKAVMAGVPVLATLSAPSSLAADLGDEVGLTLVGLVRGGSMNVYTHPSRIRS